MAQDDRRLERIEKKLDDQNDHLSSIDKTLVAQHESLKEHIKRTALLEADIKPIRRHVYMVQGAGALIALLGVLMGILASLGALK